MRGPGRRSAKLPRMRVCTPLLFVALSGACAVGCASGGSTRRGLDAGDARDTGTAIDGGSDAGGAPDASSVDAGLDAGELPDVFSPPVDAGPFTACTAATASTVCGGRPCVDGYCCDQPCGGACRGCGVAGSEGTCTSFASGSDPDDECAAQAAATCGTTGVCDGAGACALHAASVACDDGMACTSSDACDGSGTCRGAAPTACSPGAGNECCLGSCGASGCRTDPGTCADVCGASQLAVMRTCQGCGAAGAAGACQGGAVHLCDASSHVLCEQVSCGGSTYVCSASGGTWAWRTSTLCDDGNACTYGDACSAGACTGTALTCTSTACATLSCNGTASCTMTPRTGMACDDANACTYGEVCTAAGTCGTGTAITCTSTTCVDRACNGTSTCTSSPRTGLSCSDGNACTFGETCNAGGTCAGGSTVTCPADTTCLAYTCNGTSTCVSAPRNVGGACDDGNPATPIDVCIADGTCMGSTCPPTLTTVFSDAYATPSSASWTSGIDAMVGTSRWLATTSAQHGVRISGGRLEITNVRSGSPGHGQGYAYVRTSGSGSPYDTTRFQPVLDANTGQSIVWSLNMQRDDPEVTDGGFSCTSTSSQNDITVGLAYVLGVTNGAGLNSSASTCASSTTGAGYAVVMGGSSRRVRLVRFEGGLRNGTITTIAQSGSFSASAYFSVRVTYDTTRHLWTLEARSDGSSTFADPATGTYSFMGTGTDSTHTGESLGASGPYFQTGCTGLCSSTYTARFDNVSVGVRCAP